MATKSPEHAPLRLDPTSGMRKLTTSKLRGNLAKVIDALAVASECVLIVTHSKPKAVLVPYAKFLEMSAVKQEPNAAVKFLASNYDLIAASMNTPAARLGAKEAFDAGPEVFRGRPLKRA